MTQDSDEHLIRYLIGELPDSEAERLDERSITDDALAARLHALEDDLVDRYARGEVLGVPLARFQQAHRASPYLQRKVRFAESLHAWTAQSGTGRPRASTASFFGLGKWAPATAAILLIVAGGYLLRTNQRLSSEFARLETQRHAVEQQNAQLRRQLEAPAVPSAVPPAATIATFMLPPPRRGLEREAATIAVPKYAKQLAFRLEVESDAYSRFWAALKDVAGDAVVWRSPDVPAEAVGANRIATIVVPAEILRPQRYAIELNSVATSGPSELVGVYAVRITFE